LFLAAYRTDSIRNLITFLTENGYNQPLSPKLLTAPTNKDFISIFQVAFRVPYTNLKHDVLFSNFFFSSFTIQSIFIFDILQSIILQFLYKKIDPNYLFSDKLEDEIPLLFKQLRYPYAVQKSAIFSCGSPHNWPKLLGALVWLVELANMMASDLGKGIQRGGGDFDSEPNESEIFFDYLTKVLFNVFTVCVM
jgi:SMC interacting uncharacterized protein involved in chromosome segregation